MEILSEIIAEVNKIVWGPVMLTLLICAGLFLTVRTGFLQFTKFGYMLKKTILGVFSRKQHRSDDSGVSPFQAVATAMAGTIGTGSIAGLATAIVDKRTFGYGYQIFRNTPFTQIQREKRRGTLGWRTYVLYKKRT